VGTPYPGEDWTDLIGFTGYEISTLGRVKNRHGRIMKQQVATRGFMKITLGKATRLVHKLVLRSFRGLSDLEPTFRNGDKRDVRLSNLCYGSPEHVPVGTRCSKGHELVGENVIMRGNTRQCVACTVDHAPANYELPEVL
jgi:hypothetical protein